MGTSTATIFIYVYKSLKMKTLKWSDISYGVSHTNSISNFIIFKYHNSNNYDIYNTKGQILFSKINEKEILNFIQNKEKKVKEDDVVLLSEFTYKKPTKHLMDIIQRVSSVTEEGFILWATTKVIPFENLLFNFGDTHSSYLIDSFNKKGLNYNKSPLNNTLIFHNRRNGQVIN